MNMVRNLSRKDISGLLWNADMWYFYRLAGRCIREENLQRDADGLRYAPKVMFMIGMVLNASGLWEITHLTSHLQDMVKKHKIIFDGARLPNLERQ